AGTQHRLHVAPKRDGLEPEMRELTIVRRGQRHTIPRGAIAELPAGARQIDEIDTVSAEDADERRQQTICVERGRPDVSKIPIRLDARVVSRARSEENEEAQP